MGRTDSIGRRRGARRDRAATGVDGNQGDNSALESGAAYVFTRNGTSWTQQAYLKASNTGIGNVFGYSVSISGDTLVIGAQNEASAGTGVNGSQTNGVLSTAGAAYVFERNVDTWTQSAYLKAPNTGAFDQFAHAVAIAGNVIVAGSIGEDSSDTGVNGTGSDNSLSNSGAAYLYVRLDGEWFYHSYLKASNAGTLDGFGYSVAASGDTVVVGAPPGALVGSTAAGAARFGFQSKCARGATVPTGSTSFKFRAGELEFDSTSYDWLVVSGARAQYKGRGVLRNRTGTFDFILTVIDGDQPGGGGTDKFRIKITAPDGVVYDNQIGASDTAEPSTAISGGHIVIRK